MYVNAPCVCDALRSKKRALDPLELELQTAVCHHMDAEN